MIEILIVDDHPMVREGLAAMLMTEKGFEVIGTAEDGGAAVGFCRNRRPDIVLCDIRMPVKNGFEMLAELRKLYPSLNVLMLAGMPLKDEEERARTMGAKGYLPKSVDITILVKAIRGIADGSVAFACEEFIAAPSKLSNRERQVLELLASGKQRDEIALKLGIGSESVKSHLKSIMTKLDCPNATSAVSRAYELGILRA